MGSNDGIHGSCGIGNLCESQGEKLCIEWKTPAAAEPEGRVPQRRRIFNSGTFSGLHTHTHTHPFHKEGNRSVTLMASLSSAAITQIVYQTKMS